jgi:hypothetical protein
MANTRAGKPEPSFAFGHVTTARAPAQGNSEKLTDFA